MKKFISIFITLFLVLPTFFIWPKSTEAFFDVEVSTIDVSLADISSSSAIIKGEIKLSNPNSPNDQNNISEAYAIVCLGDNQQSADCSSTGPFTETLNITNNLRNLNLVNGSGTLPFQIEVSNLTANTEYFYKTRVYIKSSYSGNPQIPQGSIKKFTTFAFGQTPPETSGQRYYSVSVTPTSYTTPTGPSITYFLARDENNSPVADVLVNQNKTEYITSNSAKISVRFSATKNTTMAASILFEEEGVTSDPLETIILSKRTFDLQSGAKETAVLVEMKDLKPETIYKYHVRTDVYYENPEEVGEILTVPTDSFSRSFQTKAVGEGNIQVAVRDASASEIVGSPIATFDVNNSADKLRGLGYIYQYPSSAKVTHNSAKVVFEIINGEYDSVYGFSFYTAKASDALKEFPMPALSRQYLATERGKFVFEITGLTASTQYQYKIKVAHREPGAISVKDNESPIRFFSTLAAPPGTTTGGPGITGGGTTGGTSVPGTGAPQINLPTVEGIPTIQVGTISIGTQTPTGGAITAPTTTTTTVSREDLKYKDRLVPCGGKNTDGTDQPRCDFNQLMRMINIIIDFVIFKLAFPIFAIAFAYAGFLLLFFGSEDAKRSEAKKIAINAFWGFVIALVAWLVVRTILVSLGICDRYTLLEGIKGRPCPASSAQVSQQPIITSSSQFVTSSSPLLQPNALATQSNSSPIASNIDLNVSTNKAINIKPNQATLASSVHIKGQGGVVQEAKAFYIYGPNESDIINEIGNKFGIVGDDITSDLKTNSSINFNQKVILLPGTKYYYKTLVEAKILKNNGELITLQKKGNLQNFQTPILISPTEFKLNSPSNNLTTTTLTPQFSWAKSSSNGNILYRLQIDDEELFSEPFIYNSSPLEENGFILPPIADLIPEAKYYWRIVAENQAGFVVAQNSPFSFTTPSCIEGTAFVSKFKLVKNAFAVTNCTKPNYKEIKKVYTPTDLNNTFNKIKNALINKKFSLDDILTFIYYISDADVDDDKRSTLQNIVGEVAKNLIINFKKNPDNTISINIKASIEKFFVTQEISASAVIYNKPKTFKGDSKQYYFPGIKNLSLQISYPLKTFVDENSLKKEITDNFDAALTYLLAKSIELEEPGEVLADEASSKFHTSGGIELEATIHL